MNELLKCAKCGGEMQEGFVMDEAYSTRPAAHWIGGKPIQGFFGSIRVKGKDHLPIQTYRCSKCGYLEWYASDGP